MDELILTSNLWQAGFITYIIKCEIQFQYNGSMFLFSLPKTEAALKAQRDFNNGALIPAVEYAEIIKRLRHELYSKKNEIGNGKDHDGFNR